MSMTRPLFIVVEGLDGTGKTTVVDLISKELLARDIKNIVGKGLGSTKISSAIREELLKEKKDDQYEVLGMLFSLLDCHRNFVVPNINNDVTVILDRYIGSFYAYQTHGRNSIRSKNYLLDTFYGKYIQPDIFIHVTAPISLANERLKLRDDNLNHLDNEDTSFKTRVIKGFEEFFKTNEVYTHIHKRIPTIELNNTGTQEDLVIKVKEIIKGLTE